MMSQCRLIGAVASILFLSKALALQRSQQALPAHLQESVSDMRDCPSLFAAILTTPDGAERRNEIREMWKTAGGVYGNRLDYRYALCTNDGVSSELQAEQDAHGDMMFMPCDEGYLNGLLTRKVAHSMYAYEHHFSEYELYMKIDDDAFLSTDRLCSYMDELSQNGTDVRKAYMGVFAEGNERENAEHPVIRDEESSWFEPYDKYPFDNYPVSAKGGPGYILPYASVKEMIDSNITNEFELNNEDKSVGYWVTKLKKAKIESYVNLPGTDGYEEHKEYNYRHNATRGTFGGYPYIVHHHLEGAAIACMHEVEFSMNPNATIDECFKLNLFGVMPKEPYLHVRIHMPY